MQPDAPPTPISKITDMIEAELAAFADPEIVPFIRSLLVPPKALMRGWDYGAEGQEYVCWNVLEDPKYRTGIAFCEEGFGPRYPWGLVFLDENRGPMSIGMDSGWYSSFLDAFFESFSSTGLNIYQVTVADIDGKPTSLIPTAARVGWDEAWAEVEKLRAVDPNRNYNVDTWRCEES